MLAAGTTVQGQFGTLRIDAAGSYEYTVDNSLRAVPALRLPTGHLDDIRSPRPATPLDCRWLPEPGDAPPFPQRRRSPRSH